jgi:hypothetical protein
MRKWYWFGYFLPTLLVLLGFGVWTYTFFGKQMTKVAAVHAPEQVVVPAPTPDSQAVIAERIDRTARKKAADEQAARITAQLQKLVIPRPAPLPPAPEPAYGYAPSCAPALMPLEGWNHQSHKDKPGRIHTELRVRPAFAVRARPCLPLGDYRLPYGTLTVGPKKK